MAANGVERLETLKKNYEFRRLYSRGKSAAAPVLVVYCRQNGTDRGRVGFTVSNKIGNAVVRNGIRRRLREIYRLNSPSLQNGMDIVVVARSRAAQADYSVLEGAFMHCCGRLGIVRSEKK
jgi:ribonuclease P protein component